MSMFHSFGVQKHDGSDFWLSARSHPLRSHNMIRGATFFFTLQPFFFHPTLFFPPSTFLFHPLNLFFSPSNLFFSPSTLSVLTLDPFFFTLLPLLGVLVGWLQTKYRQPLGKTQGGVALVAWFVGCLVGCQRKASIDSIWGN